jgi:hypothetical protein
MRVFLRTAGSARPLLCKIARVTLGAPMPLILLAKVEDPGAMLRPRCPRCTTRVFVVLLRAFSGKLLDASATEAAWNYCAPVIDYDALRKEVTAVFADRAAQVQALVVKLQKTQRAAEQALDKHMPSHGVMRCRDVVRQPGDRYEKSCAS